MARKPTPIMIRGKAYPSIRAASDDLGISLAWLYRLRQQGRIDQAGLISTHPSHKALQLSITIRGISYPSYATAADALGVTISAISHAVRRGEQAGNLEQRLTRIGERRTLPAAPPPPTPVEASP